MTDYFEYAAGPKVVKLDVVEFDQPLSHGIEVEERQFDSTGQFCAYVAQQLGRAPE